MSIKIPQLIFLVVISLSYSVYHFSQPRPLPKLGRSKAFYISEYSSRGPVERTIKLKIETRALMQNHQPTAEIVAFIKMPFDYEDQLQYKWTLGQNVSLIEGTLEGSSAKSFKKEEPQAIRILVKGFDKENLRHIGFEVWGNKNNRRIYADGLISSQKENSFEDVVQHVEKIKAEKSGIKK